MATVKLYLSDEWIKVSSINSENLSFLKENFMNNKDGNILAYLHLLNIIDINEALNKLKNKIISNSNKELIDEMSIFKEEIKVEGESISGKIVDGKFHITHIGKRLVPTLEVDYELLDALIKELKAVKMRLGEDE